MVGRELRTVEVQGIGLTEALLGDDAAEVVVDARVGGPLQLDAVRSGLGILGVGLLARLDDVVVEVDVVCGEVYAAADGPHHVRVYPHVRRVAPDRVAVGRVAAVADDVVVDLDQVARES